MLAEWPGDFHKSQHIYRDGGLRRRLEYTSTNRGLEVHVSSSGWRNWWALSMPTTITGGPQTIEVALNCRTTQPDETSRRVAMIRLCPNTYDAPGVWCRKNTSDILTRRVSLIDRLIDVFTRRKRIHILHSTLRTELYGPRTVVPDDVTSLETGLALFGLSLGRLVFLASIALRDLSHYVWWMLAYASLGILGWWSASLSVPIFACGVLVVLADPCISLTELIVTLDSILGAMPFLQLLVWIAIASWMRHYPLALQQIISG